jgi:hypothetical protein
MLELRITIKQWTIQQTTNTTEIRTTEEMYDSSPAQKLQK